MRKILFLTALALVAAALAPMAALADDPVATLEADANALVGTSDKKAARLKIRLDALKLTGDWKSLRAVCLGDRAKLRADIKAARLQGVSESHLRPLVRQANVQIRITNLQMRSAVLQARLAVLKMRASFHATGQPAPSVETPPAHP